MLARQALHALQSPAISSAWCGAAPWMCSLHQMFSSQQQVHNSYSDSFQSPPKSLYIAQGGFKYPPHLEDNVFGRALLTILGAYTKKQLLRNGAAFVYDAIADAAEDTELQQALGLELGKFMSTHNLLSLHMWLVNYKLAWEGPDSKDAKIFRQALYTNQYYKDVERRIYAYGVTMHVGKWQKKLEQLFYSSCFAYDKAIVSDDNGDLVDALLKYVYDGDQSKQSHAMLLGRYMRRQLKCLQLTDIQHIYKGQVAFATDVKKSNESSD